MITLPASHVPEDLAGYRLTPEGVLTLAVRMDVHGRVLLRPIDTRYCGFIAVESDELRRWARP